MNTKQFYRRVMAALAVTVAAGALLLFGMATRAQGERVLQPGAPAQGNLTSRLGEEWRFLGCNGDVVSLTVSSEEFVPFLALFDSVSNEALIEAEGEGEDEARAAITAFTLPRTDSYSLLVLGSALRDRGAYEVTLESESAEADAIAADAVQILPGERVEGEVASRFGSEVLFRGCAEQVVSFVAESEEFVPHLELFGPSGRDPLIEATGSGTTAQIIDFALPESGVYTLIAAGEDVRDRGSFTLAMLGVNETPPTATPTATPTNTPTRTPTPSPTPTPAPQASASQPQGIPIQVNGGDGDLMGEVFMNPSYMISQFEEDDTLVVGNLFYLELFVFDIREGLYNGAGIDRVEFVFDCPNGEQYIRVEQQPRYCSFSDEGGSCYTLRMRSGSFFPNSACEIVNDYYYVNVNAYPENPDLQPGNWNFYFRPEIP